MRFAAIEWMVGENFREPRKNEKKLEDMCGGVLGLCTCRFQKYREILALHRPNPRQDFPILFESGK